MPAVSLNPIIVREVRTRMRGLRPYAILTAFLVLLALSGMAIYLLMLQQARLGGSLLSAQVGRALFRGLALVELTLVVVLAPALTAGAISGEREQLTFDMLMATPLRPGQILWGKLIATQSYLLLLIFAGIPIFSLVLIFGGVELLALLKSIVLLIVSTIFFGAIGLLCSTLMQRTARATTIAYSLTLLLVVVPLLIASAWSQLTMPPGQPVPPALLYLNPFSALLAITTPAIGGGDPFMSSLSFSFGDPFDGIPLLNVLSVGVVHYGPNGPVVIPLYRATLLAYSILIVIIGWISGHMVLPRRRWHPRWSDLGFSILLAALAGLAWWSRSWWYILPPPMF